jgi:hypothetical protein
MIRISLWKLRQQNPLLSRQVRELEHHWRFRWALYHRDGKPQVPYYYPVRSRLARLAVEDYDDD